MDKILPFHLSDLTSTSVWGDTSLLVSAGSPMDSSRPLAQVLPTLLRPQRGGGPGTVLPPASIQSLVGERLHAFFSSSELDFSSQIGK